MRKLRYSAWVEVNGKNYNFSKPSPSSPIQVFVGDQDSPMTFVQTQNSPTNLTSFSVAELNYENHHLIAVFGSKIPPPLNKPLYTSELYMFDPEKNNWTLIPLLSLTLPPLCGHKIICYQNYIISFFGKTLGKTYRNLLLITLNFDSNGIYGSCFPTTVPFYSEQTGPEPRTLFSATLKDSSIYIFGGRNQNNECLCDLWELSLRMGIEKASWKCLSYSGPSPRYDHISYISNGYLHIAGGRSQNNEKLNDVWCYTNEWEIMGYFTEAPPIISMTVNSNSKIPQRSIFNFHGNQFHSIKLKPQFYGLEDDFKELQKIREFSSLDLSSKIRVKKTEKESLQNLLKDIKKSRQTFLKELQTTKKTSKQHEKDKSHIDSIYQVGFKALRKQQSSLSHLQMVQMFKQHSTVTRNQSEQTKIEQELASIFADTEAQICKINGFNQKIDKTKAKTLTATLNLSNSFVDMSSKDVLKQSKDKILIPPPKFKEILSKLERSLTSLVNDVTNQTDFPTSKNIVKGRVTELYSILHLFTPDSN